MACCVRGYHEYKDIKAAATREVLVCGRWRAVIGKIFVVKLYSCKIFRTFSVYENIFATKKKRITVWSINKYLKLLYFFNQTLRLLFFFTVRFSVVTNRGQRLFH